MDAFALARMIVFMGNAVLVANTLLFKICLENTFVLGSLVGAHNFDFGASGQFHVAFEALEGGQDGRCFLVGHIFSDNISSRLVDKFDIEACAITASNWKGSLGVGFNNFKWSIWAMTFLSDVVFSGLGK